MVSRIHWRLVPFAVLAFGASVQACAQGEPERAARTDAGAESGADAGLVDAYQDSSSSDGNTDDAPAGDANEAGLAEAGVCDAELTINEVQPAGPGGPDDEFIELHNPGSCAVVLDGYAVFYRSDDGVADHLVWSAATGQTMQPGQFFVLGGKGFLGGADFPMSGNVALSASGGGLGLKMDEAVVDSVGWGDATNSFVEGSAPPAPAADKSLGRFPDSADTNDNSVDFVELSPSPRKTNNAW